MEFNIYLTFNGNCEEAMNFYKDVLGGEIVMISKFGDAPMPVEESQKGKVLHGILHAAGTKFMFSDTDGNHKVTFGDNFSASLNFHSDEEITKVFNTMSAGGKVTMDLQDTFWGARFGMCEDKFGVNWMFNYDKPKP
jgi:PhnB protein